MLQVVKNATIRGLLLTAWWLYERLLWRWRDRLATVLARLAWQVARRDRQRAQTQLMQFCTDGNPEEARRIARHLTEHMAHALIDALELHRDRDCILARIRFAPGAYERLHDAWREGNGVVVATGHIGHWELLGAALAQHFPLHTVTGRSYDPVLQARIESLRRRYGITALVRDDPRLTNHLKALFARGDMLALLIDQDTRAPGVFVPFFGRSAHTPSGAASLALRNRAPLLVVSCLREPAGYVIQVNEALRPNPDNEVDSEVQRLTAAATAQLEQVIRQHPEQWVWFHRRWKTRPGGLLNMRKDLSRWDGR